MNIVYKTLQLFSAGCLGVFAGAMLTEALVLVPYWRSLRPAEFFSWYAANGQRLLDFFGPLTWAAALLAIAAAIAASRAGSPGRVGALVAAGLIVVVVSTFFVYFGRANTSFAEASLKEADLPAELARWATWHWARTGLSLAALAAAVDSIRRLG